MKVMTQTPLLHSRPPSTKERASTSVNLRRGLVTLGAVAVQLGSADAATGSLRFADEPMAGASTLPSRFAPRWNVCAQDPTCLATARLVAGDMRWRQTAQLQQTDLLGAAHLPEELTALTQILDWQMQKSEGTGGFPGNVPVVDGVVFAELLTYRKTATEPLGCKQFDRAVAKSARYDNIAIVGEHHNSKAAQSFRQCLFARQDKQPTLIVMEGHNEGQVADHDFALEIGVQNNIPSQISGVKQNNMYGLEHPALHYLSTALSAYYTVSLAPGAPHHGLHPFNVYLANSVQRMLKATQAHSIIRAMAKQQAPGAIVAQSLAKGLNLTPKQAVALLQKDIGNMRADNFMDFFHKLVSQTVQQLGDGYRLDSVQKYLKSPSYETFNDAYFAITVRARDKAFADSLKKMRTKFPEHRIIGVMGSDHALHTRALVGQSEPTDRHTEL